jgi:hypothetical protein
MSIITWWLEIAVLAFTGGIAIGLGVSWLFLSPSRSQAEPGALSEWLPMLGASKAKMDHEKARFIAEQWREGAPNDFPLGKTLSNRGLSAVWLDHSQAQRADAPPRIQLSLPVVM